MAKNDNPHATRLMDSLNKHGKERDAQELAERYPLSKSATFEKKFAWAEDICKFLEEKYDEETIKEIRIDCACGTEMGKGNKIKKILDKESDPYIFVEKVNKLDLGYTLEYDGTYYYLEYPQCYCSCVKRVEQPLSNTWCYCTLGYTKRMFDFLFDRDVQVELLSSIKLGDNCCRIKIW